jgi:PAS domain S-box-containing protein
MNRWLLKYVLNKTGGIILLALGMLCMISITWFIARQEQKLAEILALVGTCLLALGLACLLRGGMEMYRTRLHENEEQTRSSYRQEVVDARRSAVQSDAIFNALADSVIVYDPQEIAIRANPQAIALFGFDPVRMSREQISRRIQVIDEDNNLVSMERMPSSRAFAGESLVNQRLQLTNYRKRSYIVLVTAAPVFIWRDMIGVVTVWRDISERERLLMENRRQHELLEQLVRSMNDFVFTLDREHRITGVFGGTENMSLKPENILGRRLDEVLSEEVKDRVSAVDQVLAGQPAILEWMMASSAGYIYFQANLSPLRDTKDFHEVCGVVGVIRDISALKRAELSLAETAERLRRSNQDLEQFAFVASHDLQEPLRKVQAFGDILMKSLAERLSGDDKDYFKRMMLASARMQRMIQDLLLLSRIATQGRPFIEVDINEVAREVISDLEMSIHTSAGQVTVGSLPVIEADPLQMRQLFQNLVGNGLKFHRPEVPARVNIRAKADSEKVQLEFEDNGIGFDEKHLERIFQPFGRLHGMEEYEGNGMGLAICKKIVDRHHGTITALSRPEQGSTFVVILPTHQAAAGSEH